MGRDRMTWLNSDAEDRLQPLQGIRVLDLSRVLAGPYCTMTLGDMGADVIKVEQPGVGDISRHWGPPWAGEESAYFLCVNRNKRSVTINLKSEEGRDLLLGLARHSQVLVENFQPSYLDYLGVGYQRLREVNPGLVYCAISGFGRSGPLRDLPGFDIQAEALTGLMSITGEPEGPPMKVGIAVIDIVAGVLAATSILGALRISEETGHGQRIDISLYEVGLAMLVNIGSNYLIGGDRPHRVGNAHANIVPFQTFKTSSRWITLCVGTDAQWQRFCDAAGLHELAQDDRFRTNRGRVAHREILVPILEQRLAERSAEEWLQLLEGANVPASPILGVDEAFEHPQTKACDMVLEVDHPTSGKIRLAGFPFKFSMTPPRVRYPPPRLGEHTDEIMAELLGLEGSDTVALRERGVI